MLFPWIKNLPFLRTEKPTIAACFLSCLRNVKECAHVCLLTYLASVIDHISLIQNLIHFPTTATVSCISEKQSTRPVLVVS